MITIDLGSNTLRVLAYDCIHHQSIAAFEHMVKTADGLIQTGRISQEAITRIISAIRGAQKQIDFGGQTIRAVTTEALRQAHNATEVLQQIKEETGIAFEIISGEEEATLTLLAVRHRLRSLSLEEDSFVLVDIGGGSTELILHTPMGTYKRSFPIGIVTTSQHYHTLEAIRLALPIEMAEIRNFCQEAYATYNQPSLFVTTAGTPTTVAAMKLGQTYATYDPQQINGTVLTVIELERYLQQLLAMPLEDRERTVGIGRSDLIAAGILIFEELFSILGFKECMVVDDGLREGIALQACEAIG